MRLQLHARLAVLAGLACLLASCGFVTPKLEPAATSYYDYMQGLDPGRSFSSFASPAYRKALPAQSVKKFDEVMARGHKKNPRARPIKATEIRAATVANFGLTEAGPDASYATQTLGKTRWVRDGGKWYLFLGSDAEVKQYGQFPVQLVLPPLPRKGAEPDLDAPQ
jgi:hypothetical protein